ncbi:MULTISPECIES: helix-turn-helix domain-containing protein [Campylobacter]|uniref:HTH cro/C1-type domain-containing protein n=1 Tax=Campylobacter curvus (strain 525.92) TaxID=360105 RepID=A0A0M4TKE4_CAMC5|nr:MULTISPECIES: helix-turn-helix transcriptional regulator [Campylobacter]ALF45094.1 hypothetical protein CCV52592_0894 [Campylobacter curvus 525.92]EJP74986.1 DNA-binding helix-turn-helix protein [Campylobacter sp. FOBRC14]MBN7288746.1 helix-turn-helix transcriptional regulator [Campylobacter curvus]MDU6827854.1 helix-turn-helix transcriptional regulator [Campylobacter sp.]
MAEKNIVKRVCAELGITQKELAQRLGIHITAVQKWVANADNLPEHTIKTLDLLLENHELKNKVEKINTLLQIISELQKER